MKNEIRINCTVIFQEIQWRMMYTSLFTVMSVKFTVNCWMFLSRYIFSKMATGITIPITIKEFHQKLSMIFCEFHFMNFIKNCQLFFVIYTKWWSLFSNFYIEFHSGHIQLNKFYLIHVIKQKTTWSVVI